MCCNFKQKSESKFTSRHFPKERQIIKKPSVRWTGRTKHRTGTDTEMSILINYLFEQSSIISAPNLQASTSNFLNH